MRKLRGNGSKCLSPACRDHAAILAEPRPIQPAALQAIEGKAAAIGHPFLIHSLIDAWQNAQHFGAARINADIGAHGIQHINAIRLAQFPWTRHESIRPAGERTDRADINQIAGKLRRQRLFHIGADFHILTAIGAAQFRRAGNLGSKTHAACALNAARHHGFDERADILVLHRPLGFTVTRLVMTIGIGLVLQITFTALVANRAIKRVIDEQKFHHTTPRITHHGRVRENLHPIHDRIGTGSDRLWRLFHFHQAHAAIAGDAQAFMIAKARDFLPRRFAGLQHGRPIRDFHFNAINRDLRHGAYSAASGMECRFL